MNKIGMQYGVTQFQKSRDEFSKIKNFLLFGAARAFTSHGMRDIMIMKTEYRKSLGEPVGVRGNGVRFSDRTAAVWWSCAHDAIGES